MGYYCDACDKTFTGKRKNKHLKNLSHNEFDKRVQTKHIIENPDLFHIEKIFKEYITNHKKN